MWLKTNLNLLEQGKAVANGNAVVFLFYVKENEGTSLPSLPMGMLQGENNGKNLNFPTSIIAS